MKKSKFTEEQIAFVLRQADAGTRVIEVGRKMGISAIGVPLSACSRTKTICASVNFFFIPNSFPNARFYQISCIRNG